MDVTVSELMASFLDSPLVLWVKTCGPLSASSEDSLSVFMELVDGVFLHKVMTHIDPSPTNQRVNKNVNNDINLRVQNLNTVIRHIKNYYQECLQQLIVMNLPNVLTIAKDPLSEKAMEEMKKLLLLILGCAVQCERKEEFIEKIKSLDIETQAAIVAYIQEVTHNQENVLDLQWLEVSDLPSEELDPLSRTMAFHLRRLIDERDDCAEVIVELTQERDYLLSQQPPNPPPAREPDHSPQEGPITLLCREDRQHLAVELADSKAKLRRARQELEEKTEQLVDTRSELERLEVEMQKLKQENTQLLAEARSARVYRDELDALRERAARVDRLETELSRCREKLHDVHFYRTRVEELREDNLTLLETKALLEEQLAGARRRCDKLHELEKENLQLRSKLHDVEMERDTDKKRLEELLEENMLLEISQKQSMNESAHLGWELEQLAKNNDVNGACKSFVLELNESTSSQLLKLEKENQSLQSTIQELRQASLNTQESQLRALELEKENQGLSKKLERLQTLLEQERQTTQDMGNLGEELLKDKLKLERLLEAVQTEKCRQISELEVEKEQLSQTVTALRQRAQADSEARVREVERENRSLHQTISDTGSRLACLEAEKRQTIRELEQLRKQCEQAKDLEQKVAHLERSHEDLQKQAAGLQEAHIRVEALERENAGLEQDNCRLKKLADSAQNSALRLKVLEEEHRRQGEENLELQRTTESLKLAAAKVSQLQQENSELEREREELSLTVDSLRALAKKAERLELSYQGLNEENRQLRQSLEESAARAQALEQELHDAEAESQQLQRELEERRVAARRSEALEEQKQTLEQELGQLEKEKKQMEREVKRLRQQLEVKETALDESSLRLACLEKEARMREKELSCLKEASGKVKELERENKELQKLATIDKRTLATLREDLVNEKLKVQQQWNEMEKLSQELEKIGLNRERLLQEEHNCEDDKYKILETKIESTLKKTLEIREEKIQSLESRLEESSSLNLQLRTELTAVKKNLEALKQRQEEEEAHSRSIVLEDTASPKSPRLFQEKWETEEREATAELLKLKDRLIDIEKNVRFQLCHFSLISLSSLCRLAPPPQNAALQTEKQLQKEQLRQLDAQNTQLNSQVLALQRQTAALQEHNTALHTQTAKLQVETSTLSSQSAALLAQNATLQGQAQTLEAEAEALLRQRDEAQAGREAALHDHERLLAVHERQAAEFEQLMSRHTALKSAQRSLEQEHRVLESKYEVLQTQKAAMEELESTLQRERESLGDEVRKNALLLGENQSLRGEMDRCEHTHVHLRQEYDGLQQHTKELKTSLNETQLELNSWQARYDQLKERHQSLDISFTKLENHCELLTRLKGNLEEENHHLMSQVQILAQQNQTLLEQTMESRELYHEEQKQYIDKLNTLRRQKEKLEEKIMDQYKFYDPTPKKRNHWVGAKALVRLMKPKKESSHERVQSSMDTVPLLSPPADCPEGPSLTLPPRQPRLSLDSVGAHSLEENHIHSPSITPNHNGRGRRLMNAQKSTNGGNFSYTLMLFFFFFKDKCVSFFVQNETDWTHNLLFAQLFERDLGSPQSASTAVTQNTSSSNSPVNSKGGPHIQFTLFLQSTLVTQGHRALTKRLRHICLGRSTPHRPPSPGSEMVTLEEFLQETNVQSPTIVRTRENLMCDFFNKAADLPAAGRCTSSKDGARMPTSYVTPTVKGMPLGDMEEGRTPRPGQSVKPSLRVPEATTAPSATPSPHAQTPPGQVGSGGVARSSHPHLSGCRGSSNLSRTFSLASADLLQSSGPGSYRHEGGASWPSGEDCPEDVVLRRPAVAARERPQSARLVGPLQQPTEVGCRPLDPRRLSFAPPKDTYSLEQLRPPSQHQSSSLSLCETGPGRRASPQVRPKPQHRAEVAMVTPVRAVPALKEEEQEEWQQVPQVDSPQLKMHEAGGRHMAGTEEQPKNTPVPPDPNGDPQTVWYEYGCV
uniref:Coiled-coil domain containing 88C n=1 Tax=Scleropages formosus TaxID=113540 RepID=A0A8C9TKI0_SCLFO